MPETTAITKRPALANLPALPLHQRPRITTTKTSPAVLSDSSVGQSLTPPSTPLKAEPDQAPRNTYQDENRLSVAIDIEQLPLPEAEQVAQPAKAESEQTTGLKLCNGEYVLHEVLGHGVWSNVYRATELLEKTTNPGIHPLSPPTSPISGWKADSKKILAIKKPSRRDAHRILENEARTLTFLHSHKEASTYLVSFHGYDTIQTSIVLDAIPMSLETHAKSARKRPLSTKTMFDPIIGAEEWAAMAEHLVAGLAFLHSQDCVHGDIKPANILLKLNENQRLIPSYCDFSSARINSPATPFEEIEEVSAVTADYTSPELLEVLHKPALGRAVVTFASDMFALAVTLLYAALGESPYACARMEIQKLGMAKEGVPLEYARRGEQASRVMEGRAVERALTGGLARDPRTRLGVEGWERDVREVLKIWKEGARVRGG